MSDSDSDFDAEIAKLEAELAGGGGGSGSDSSSASSSGGGGGGGGGGGDDDDDMKKLLNTWESEHSKGSDSSSDSDDDSSEEERREIDLDDNTIDHIVLAAEDFEQALEEFEEKTSIQPQISGSIKGLGIKTARISFEGASYLEIIAPDPEDNGPIGNLLLTAGLDGLVPFHYAIRNEKCEEMRKDMAKIGYTPDHISMFGAKEDGTPRKWEMLYLYGHKMGGICPFIINWANSDHPCETLPIVGELKYVKVQAPKGDPMHKLMDQINPNFIDFSEGSKSFEFSFSSPEGTITFKAKQMVGFRFPGFEEECGPVDGEDDDDGQDDDVDLSPPPNVDDDDDDDDKKKKKKKKDKDKDKPLPDEDPSDAAEPPPPSPPEDDDDLLQLEDDDQDKKDKKEKKEKKDKKKKKEKKKK